MKKVMLLVALAVFTLAGFQANAQTRIGSKHVIDLGLHYGYGSMPVHHFFGGQIDVNIPSNNFRVRLYGDMLQRPTQGSFNNTGIGFGANFQYLLPLNDGEGFYLYPSIGYGIDICKVWKKEMGHGFNLGGGAEYQVTDRWALFFEGKYEMRFGGHSRAALQAGFNFAL